MINAWRLRPGLSVLIATAVLSACGGGGGGAQPPVDLRGVNDTYLFVSYQSQALDTDIDSSASADSGTDADAITNADASTGADPALYYGTLPVGSVSSVDVKIANRGADIYPLRNIVVKGANADEFATNVLDDVILHPTEFVNIKVQFQPITEGQKEAQFVVDYETIQMVDESVNVNEQSFYKANELASAGEFRAAHKTYSDYLSNDPVTVNKHRAAIRLPIIDEAQHYDSEEELGLYLEAHGLRDEQAYQLAIRKLNTFTALYPDSYLADDALYLKGYIELMDLDKPQQALQSMQILRSRFPDTTYYDTSLYSEAIAMIELGNIDTAIDTLLDLKARHTGIDALGIQLPKDNLVSRMWFDRASSMLKSV